MAADPFLLYKKLKRACGNFRSSVKGLFKYFPTDDYRLDKLACHQILLTPPKYFNDPWDFRVQRVPITKAEISAQCEKFGKDLPHLGDVEASEYGAAVTRPEFREGEGPEMQEELSKQCGVVSLTSDPLDRLMWAHYAESHRGFVVEFATVGDSRGVDTPFGVGAKVKYKSKLPKFNKKFSNPLEVLYTKHSCWRYENEWRVVQWLKNAPPEPFRGKMFHLLRFKPKFVIRVIFGLRVEPNVEEKLLKMLSTTEFAHVEKERIKIDASSGELSCCPW